MDILGLGNIINALRSRRVGNTQKSGETPQNKGVTGSKSTKDSPDTVSISDESVIRSAVEKTANEIKQESETVRTDKVAEIKEKLHNGEYDEYDELMQQTLDSVITGSNLDIYDILR
jgi:anti-sigma28 factor (negative regulator of flagellin synthesis)